MNTTHADGAECAVLGACLKDARCIPDVLSDVLPEDYRKPEHKAIHKLIQAFHQRGDTIDEVSLPMAVAQSGQPDLFGGIEYVMALADQCASTAALPTYIRQVLEASKRRKLRQVGVRLLEALEEGKSSAHLVAGVTGALQKIAAAGARGPESLGDVSGRVSDRVNASPEEQERSVMSTGLEDLDVGLGGGLRRGELVLVGARPGMGKTALAVGMAADAAHNGRSALVFSSEMTADALGERLIAYDSGVPFGRIRRPSKMSDAERRRVTEAAQRIQGNHVPFWIDDRSQPKLAQIEGVARRHQTAHGLDLVVIDYFQILGLEVGRDGNRIGGMNDMSSGLMRLAKDLNCCVVLLSQLNRNLTVRKDAIPTMADLKGCGKLEEDAHVILLPHRPSEYDSAASEEEATIYIAKNRSGPTGEVLVRWDPDFVRFAPPDSAFFDDDDMAAK